MNAPQVETGDHRLADSLIEDIIELYTDVYSEPPYNEGPAEIAVYRERFQHERAQLGFQITTLRAASRPTELAGIAYGYTLGPSAWWPEAITPAPPELLTNPVAAVLELAIRNQHRGQGLGTTLMNTFLENRAEPYATLCAHPDAPARAIYTHWGWKPAGQAHPDNMDTLDILAMALR